MNVFDFVKAINSHNNIVEESSNPDYLIGEYIPFLINKNYSLYIDTIIYANDMNLNSSVDKRMQFDYFFNSIRPYKRFSKWPKPKNNEYINIISDYFKVNKRKATEICKILTTNQLEEIKEKLVKGE